MLTDPGVAKQNDPSRPIGHPPQIRRKRFVCGFKVFIVGFGEGWGGVETKNGLRRNVLETVFVFENLSFDVTRITSNLL